MLQVQHINFGFHPPKMILQDLNFEVQKGEFLSVLGESGSGKSSLLKLIYGLEDASSGQIQFENQQITGPKFNLIPGHPEMKLVPQEFDLLDYVTVSENVGKYLSNFDLPIKKETIEKALEVVKLTAYKDEFPNKLSGGQRQRVGLARALAASPDILLMDEPFGAVDEITRKQLQQEIKGIHQKLGVTIFFVTHDIREAMKLGTRVLIMDQGKIMQEDTPSHVRDHPRDGFVRELLESYLDNSCG